MATPRNPDAAATNPTLGIYGGRVFDSRLESCATCGNRLAFGYSVRIRQDINSEPRCFDCRPCNKRRQSCG